MGDYFTGRYVSKAAAARHPRSSVTETGRNTASGTQHRSAIIGRYVTEATAERHPNTTVAEKGQ